MLRTTLFKGVKGRDSVCRRCLRARSANETQRAEAWGLNANGPGATKMPMDFVVRESPYGI